MQNKDIQVQRKIDHSAINLHIAINNNNLNEVKSLIKNGIDINYMVYGQSPLEIAIFKENFEIANFLIDSGADLKLPEKTKCGRYPIHIASCSSNVELVEKMILKNRNLVNLVDAMLLTPLHLAAYFNQYAVGQLLINNGSNINAIDDLGRTPLHRACENNHLQMARLLLEYGGNVDSIDFNGWTPICVNVICYNLEMVSFLLDNKADLRTVDFNGQNTLHLACDCRSRNNISVLSGLSIDIYVRHLNVVTNSVLAASFVKSSDPRLVHILLNYGADVNAIDIYGNSPFKLAYKAQLKEVLSVFINAGYFFNDHFWIVEEESKVVRNDTKDFFLPIRTCIRTCIINLPICLKLLCKYYVRYSLRMDIDKKIGYLPLPIQIKNQLYLNDSL